MIHVAQHPTQDALLTALDACRIAGGGRVYAPAGVYPIARRGRETPILPLPSNTILEGDGPATVFKFVDAVNQANNWCMLGATTDCRNSMVRDLSLDGAAVGPYDPKRQQVHLLFFDAKEGSIDNLTIQNVLARDPAGDCIGVRRGCRNVIIRDVRVGGFRRHGVYLGAGDRDFLLDGVQELPSAVWAEGSTIHIEDAGRLDRVTIINGHFSQSALISDCRQLLFANNHVHGRIAGAKLIDSIIRGNQVIRATGLVLGGSIEFGYCTGLTVDDNDCVEGIYVYGNARVGPSRDVWIHRNQARSIELKGVERGCVHHNHLPAGVSPVLDKRCVGVEVSQ